ncbi:MAG: Ig-like domain repeat protein, partial [Isosphaeraceae bacterium]
SLAGSGSVLFGAGNPYANNRITTAVSNGDSGTLTIGSGITLHGNTGLIGNASLPLINQGTIADDISGGSLAVYGTNWSSTGALEASNGGSVELYGALTNSGTIEANGGSVVGLNGSWANSGTITANAGGVSLSGTGTNAGAIQDANGGILTSSGGALTNTGIVEADGTSTVSLNNNSVTINSSGIMIAQPSATLGIAGSLFGNTTDKDLFQPNGTVDLDGSGSSTIPQFLEVMGDDLGNVPAGFLDNFVYGTLAVGSKDYVRLVDLQNNSGSSSPEALYVNTLIVPSGSTLDLNGLHLYYRAGEINGTITAGSATPLLGGGPLPLNSSAPGNLQVAGEVDDWTFFGRAGQSVDLFLHTGSGGAPAPIQPALNHGEITLLDPNGNQVAIASNSQSGADASILNEMLPADGTYQIEVQAASGSSASLGNYVVAEYDAGVYTSAIDLDQTVYGQLNSPYSQDQWTLSATADTQINFDLIASANPSLQFSLTGPDGFIGFSGLSTGSELVTLPTSGTYVLNASTSQAAAGGGAYAFRVYQTAPTDLALGTEYHGTLIGSGQPQLFVLNVPAASPMFAQIADADTSDHIELYAKFKAPPTREDYDYGANGVGSSQSLLIPSATAGTWYLLVYAESVASTPGYFTLQVNATPLVVNAVTPVQYGTNAVATFTLNGAGFTSATSVSLVGSDNTVYPASSVSFDTFTQLTATISLAGVPQGTYSVQVTTSDGSISTLPAAFTVTAAGQANFQTQLILPDGVGRHISSTFYVEYSNTGTVAMPAPLLLLESSLTDDLPLFTLDPSLVYSGSWTSAIPEGYSNTVEILASGKVPGVLGPGESVTVPVYYAGMELPWNFGESHFEFDLQVFNTTDVVPVDLDRLLSSSQPAGISNNAWESIYPTLLNEIDQFGTYNPPYPIPGFLDTDLWSSYVKFLDSEAVYLGQLGEDVTDVSQLWGFAVQQADNDLSPVGPYLASATDDSVATPGDLSLSFSRVYSTSVDGRVALGPLGVGWSTPWQTSASTASDGTVTIAEGDGTQRVFQPDSRTSGVFFSQTGDTGTLTADGNGGYLLTEADGSATDYNPNGTLNDIEDTNGNRITAGYTNGQLTSLTASSGQWIDIGYNAAGLISTITDSQSRVTTYAYESISQYHDVPPEPYLAAVTGFNGQTTSYSYEPTSNFAFFDEESLTSIAFPGGTHQYFTYNAYGWLASICNDDGAQPLSFAYALGQVSVTDGAGDTSNLYYNEEGMVVKSIDPLGNVSLITYDNKFNLTKVTNALGQSETYTYNAAGEATSSTDFLGNTTYFTYSGPFNQLASMTDANGNTTSYAYDSSGDLLSTTYANGTSESFTYDPEGNATSFLNANGQPTQYAYNAAGQITTETFSDGSQYAYTYDGQGNLVTATDATGTTTFTYDPTTELLTEVAYPNDMSLTFTYNAAGQRTSVVDQTGFTVNYDYDTIGRLSELADGSGNPIVTYTYDAAGRVSGKTNGNGTYTTYQYDADGNVLDLINYAPGGTVDSRFDYTYNSLGLETSEATLDGSWTYTYDVDGQLIHAVFASTNPNVPSQDLAYNYDAMGNRITTVINGVSTAYTTNNMNQYTSVGGVADTYDADGNLTSDGTNTYRYDSLNQLISVVGPSGMTSYTYNALGQRVASTTNGQTTQYVIDPSGLGNVVSEYDGSGNLLAHYNYGFGLVSQVNTSENSYFYNFSAIGNTSELTNASGVVVNSYTYDPFGVPLGKTEAVANPFQYVGEYGVMNEGNGLEFMGVRSYEAAVGRFVQPDPIGIDGGINLYKYGENLPTRYIDPVGTCGVWFPIGLDPHVDPWEGQEPYHFADPFNPPPSPYCDDGGQCIPVLRPAPDPGPFLVPAPDPGPFLVPAPPIDPPFNPAPNNPDLIPPQYKYGPVPTPPPCLDCSGQQVYIQHSYDPNSLIGPAGFGSDGFIALGLEFPYRVNFENEPTATAPAQRVDITDQLDTNLDWTTFQLTQVGFGDTIIDIPPDSQHFQTTVPITENGQNFDVQIELGANTATGQVYAQFLSIDPNTQLPPDVLTGFLPPEDGTGRGMGFFSYIIQPKAGLPTGTQTRNVALISFDLQPSIATDQVNDDDPSQGVDPNKQDLNTIDSVPPTSSVGPLPRTETSSSFTVTWSGQDDPGGSGIAFYNIYDSEDGGPYSLWQSDTTDTSATFTGQPGHTYAFYSVATDNVGNVQPTPASAQQTVQVLQAPTTTTVTPGTASVGFGQSAPFTATVSSASGAPPDGSVQFIVNGAAYGSPVALSGSIAQLAITEPAGSYTIAAQYTGDADYAATLAAAESTASLTVSPVATATAVTPSAATVSFGQSATFAATVSSAAGAPPDGAVQFLVNGAAYGSPVALSSGTAQLAITEPAGSYAVAAQYMGDANYAATVAAAETMGTLTVNQPMAPATNLAISPNTGISAGLTDTGAVTFTGSLSAAGMTVDVFDTSTNTDLRNATVTGTSFSLAL